MEIELVNILAGGDFDSELDLEKLFEHFRSDESVQVEYNPSSCTALLFRDEVGGPLSMVYRTGKFVIIGAKSETQLNRAYDNLVIKFRDSGVIDQKDSEIDIYNKIFKACLGKDINLSAFAVHIGFERAEYEPEQAPFLVYRSSEQDGVITVASSGKAVINGVQTEDEARDLLRELNDDVRSMPLNQD